jgi:hypothetical protein
MFSFDIRFFLFGFGDRNFPLLILMFLFMSLVWSGRVLPTILPEV